MKLSFLMQLAICHMMIMLMGHHQDLFAQSPKEKVSNSKSQEKESDQNIGLKLKIKKTNH